MDNKKVSNKNASRSFTIEDMKNSNIVIRANTPIGYDVNIHKAIRFKRENYESYYELMNDGYYQYIGISVESSIHYSEAALLGLSNITVVGYVYR